MERKVRRLGTAALWSASDCTVCAMLACPYNTPAPDPLSPPRLMRSCAAAYHVPDAPRRAMVPLLMTEPGSDTEKKGVVIERFPSRTTDTRAEPSGTAPEWMVRDGRRIFGVHRVPVIMTQSTGCDIKRQIDLRRAHRYRVDGS